MFDAVKYWQEKKERQRLRTRGVVMAAAALMHVVSFSGACLSA